MVRPCALTEKPCGMPLEFDQGDLIKVRDVACLLLVIVMVLVIVLISRWLAWLWRVLSECPA